MDSFLHPVWNFILDNTVCLRWQDLLMGGRPLIQEKPSQLKLSIPVMLCERRVYTEGHFEIGRPFLLSAPHPNMPQTLLNSTWWQWVLTERSPESVHKICAISAKSLAHPDPSPISVLFSTKWEPYAFLDVLGEKPCSIISTSCCNLTNSINSFFCKGLHNKHYRIWRPYCPCHDGSNLPLYWK